jgi:hypothetical protein
MSRDDPKPERWQADVHGEPFARLEIAADLHRERQFEIGIALTVSALESAVEPWHELRVFADGQLQWSRRIATAKGQPYDGLDMRFSRRVPPGRTLAVLAQSDVGGARRLRITIEADEV